MCAPLAKGDRPKAGPLVPIWTSPNRPRTEHEEHVILLDDWVEWRTHFTFDNASIECDDDCPFCRRGDEPRLSYFAPALLHIKGQDTPEGLPVWTPVVYYLPKGSIGALKTPRARGRYFVAWKMQLLRSNQGRFRFEGRGYTTEFELPPAFDVRVRVRARFTRTEADHQAAREQAQTVPEWLVLAPKRIAPAPEARRPDLPPEVGPEERRKAQELLRSRMAPVSPPPAAAEPPAKTNPAGPEPIPPTPPAGRKSKRAPLTPEERAEREKYDRPGKTICDAQKKVSPPTHPINKPKGKKGGAA